MGLQVIPTNIGGVSLNSLASPLASLLGGTPSAQYMTYPSDLGSNPAMGHAVIFQAYDYKTGLGNSIGNLINATAGFLSQTSSQIQAGTLTTKQFTAQAAGLINPAIQTGLNSITASEYQPLTQGDPLATISLFMPDELQIDYSATWNEISLAKELGALNTFANAYSDIKSKGLTKDAVAPYATKFGSSLAGKILGSGTGELISQSLGIAMTNPQTQLLYSGTKLREFNLKFILTPKTASEAQTIKNICDSFAYFTLPGVSGSQTGSSGQYFTPPQVFRVQFKFLGGSGTGNQISNTFATALNNTGLNVLTNVFGGSTEISGGSPAKTFTVNDCVLESVNVDYTPNGWATYNDGYPVQTVLSLRFRETTVYTKQNMAQTAVAQNYNLKQQANQQITDSITNLNGSGSNVNYL